MARTPATDSVRTARERVLADALIRGDTAAPAMLWEHFSPLVEGLLIRALGPADAEDNMQEIFMRIFNKGHTLRDPGQLRSYVVTITIYFIRSLLRKRRIKRQLSDRLLAWTEPGESTAHPDAIFALRTLCRSLERLATGDRLAFTLRYFEGLELTEAAIVTNTSLATFKRRLQSARQRLWILTGEDPLLAPYLSGRTCPALQTALGT